MNELESLDTYHDITLGIVPIVVEPVAPSDTATEACCDWSSVGTEVARAI